MSRARSRLARLRLPGRGARPGGAGRSRRGARSACTPRGNVDGVPGILCFFQVSGRVGTARTTAKAGRYLDRASNAIAHPSRGTKSGGQVKVKGTRARLRAWLHRYYQRPEALVKTTIVPVGQGIHLAPAGCMSRPPAMPAGSADDRAAHHVAPALDAPPVVPRPFWHPGSLIALARGRPVIAIICPHRGTSGSPTRSKRSPSYPSGRYLCG
jgi:hypothetical protein